MGRERTHIKHLKSTSLFHWPQFTYTSGQSFTKFSTEVPLLWKRVWQRSLGIQSVASRRSEDSFNLENQWEFCVLPYQQSFHFYCGVKQWWQEDAVWKWILCKPQPLSASLRWAAPVWEARLEGWEVGLFPKPTQVLRNWMITWLMAVRETQQIEENSTGPEMFASRKLGW